MAFMNQFAFTGGCIAGAAGMFLLDPHRGAYRRSVVRDKAIHYGKTFRKRGTVVGRDLAHRTEGVLAQARHRVLPQRVPDDILVARVASKLGRVVSNPHALELTADEGRVIVAGPIYTDEAENLVRAIRKVPGVRGIENQLELHSRNERFPGLQGRRHLRGEKLDIFQSRWAPATRFLVGLAGGLIAVSTGLALKKVA